MRKKNSFGDILGAMADGFSAIIKGLIRLTLKILITFGLWLPLLYALLGVILYIGADFQPFDFSVYSVIYLSGGVACIVCSIMISLRNIFVLPFKTIFSRRRDMENEKWADEEFAEREQAERRVKEAEEKKYSPPEYDDFPTYEVFSEDEKPLKEEENEKIPEYLIKDELEENERKTASALLFDWTPKKATPKSKSKMVSEPKKEIPEVYFSKLNPGILVHEYNDRFELYKIVGEKTEYVGVEYK